MSKWITSLGDAKRIGQELIAICHNPMCRHRQAVDLDTVIHHVGAAHSLVPVRGQVHFSERMRCPACGSRGMFIWLMEPKVPEPTFSSLTHEVRSWSSDPGFDLIAKVGHVSVAHSAFQSAIEVFPRRRITLQQGTHVIMDSRLKVIDGGRA